ncbi:MAG: NAD(P)/FAD-dependent oxidoreductase [Deltaproteobacteria bacterium]|jgi:protoporphyrinogen oxidase|nr:NAD(P)/FAD-dependent oxidoreductase [Deltaproteobacteria bacterium]
MNKNPVVIIGAGPAGLAAGYELIKNKISPVILERSSTVGGISRTESYKGFHFDIGGHRFFSKNDAINRQWQEMLGPDFLQVKRLSRIYYQKKFFNYPLRPVNAFLNLGPIESFLILLSYCRASVSPQPEEISFEEWVINRFGERLYLTFFKTYTEKVWGVPCKEIRADWAAQRIKGLSLFVAVSNALFGGGQKAKSLIEQFYYPKLGPGMMWQRFKDRIIAGGGEVRFNSEVFSIRHENGTITAVEYSNGTKAEKINAENFISSTPISCLVKLLEPQPPAEVLESAEQLTYRAFIIVVLIVDRPALFPDQWLYVHSPKVQVGRIQNFKNWSRSMVPDQSKTSIGMEYFCNVNDRTWKMADKELVAMACREMEEMGFAQVSEVIDSFVVRQSHAYPVYDSTYKKNLLNIRNYLDNFSNLQTIGRSGMHRYNNMDHSMETGILAAKNCYGEHHDVWAVNEEKSYLEEDRPVKEIPVVPEKVLIRAFARIDKFAFAVALGTICGLLVSSATLWIISRGGDVLNSHLRLLAQYFIGYTVTVKGAFIAFGYSFFWGFLFGWFFAYLRNLFLAVYIFRIKRKVELMSLKDFFDNF